IEPAKMFAAVRGCTDRPAAAARAETPPAAVRNYERESRCKLSSKRVFSNSFFWRLTNDSDSQECYHTAGHLAPGFRTGLERMEVGVHDRTGAEAADQNHLGPRPGRPPRADRQVEEAFWPCGGGAGTQLLRGGPGWLLAASVSHLSRD